MKKYTLLLALALTVPAAACNDSHGRDDDAGPRPDAGLSADAGWSVDGGSGSDAGMICRPPTPERHRASADVCPMDRPFFMIEEPSEPFWTCTTHEECTDGINGHCTGNSFHGYACSYDRCFSDAECDNGPCACRGAGGGGTNHCLQGNCQTDADCGEGIACSPTLGMCGDYSGTIGYYCHTCDDECTDDADCGGAPSYCAYNELSGHWACQDSHCAG